MAKKVTVLLPDPLHERLVLFGLRRHKKLQGMLVEAAELFLRNADGVLDKSGPVDKSTTEDTVSGGTSTEKITSPCQIADGEVIQLTKAEASWVKQLLKILRSKVPETMLAITSMIKAFYILTKSGNVELKEHGTQEKRGHFSPPKTLDDLEEGIDKFADSLREAKEFAERNVATPGGLQRGDSEHPRKASSGS